MIDPRLVNIAAQKIDNAIDRTLEQLEAEGFKVGGRTKKEKEEQRSQVFSLLRSFAYTGVNISVSGLQKGDGLITPHVLGEAIKVLAKKHGFTKLIQV